MSTGRTEPRPRRPVRFLVAGAVNTAVTFGIYLGLLRFVPYPAAYSIAFAIGIAFAYWLNRFYVFKSGAGLRSMLLFPLVYVGQYLVGLAIVVVWVDLLGLPPSLASLAAVAVTIPLTYLSIRALFTADDRH